jgi:hypothetical protein
VSRTRWLLASGELGIAHAKAQEKQEEKEKKNLPKKRKAPGVQRAPVSRADTQTEKEI